MTVPDVFFGGDYDKLVIVSLQLLKISLTITFPREIPPSFWNQSRCLHNLLPSPLLYKIWVKSVLLGIFIRAVIWKERAAVDFRQRSLETCVVTGVDFVESGAFLPPRHWLWRRTLRGPSDFALFLSPSQRLPGKFSSLLDRTCR